MDQSRRGSATDAVGGRGDAQTSHPARGKIGSVSADHVNPALSMGPGDPYVNASSPLSS